MHRWCLFLWISSSNTENIWQMFFHLSGQLTSYRSPWPAQLYSNGYTASRPAFRSMFLYKKLWSEHLCQISSPDSPSTSSYFLSFPWALPLSLPCLPVSMCPCQCCLPPSCAWWGMTWRWIRWKQLECTLSYFYRVPEGWGGPGGQVDTEWGPTTLPCPQWISSGLS